MENYSRTIMSLNIYRDVAMGTKGLTVNALTMTTEAMRSKIFGTINGISKWTLGSMCKVLMGTGKLAVKGVMALPIIPGSKA